MDHVHLLSNADHFTPGPKTAHWTLHKLTSKFLSRQSSHATHAWKLILHHLSKALLTLSKRMRTHLPIYTVPAKTTDTPKLLNSLYFLCHFSLLRWSVFDIIWISKVGKWGCLLYTNTSCRIWKILNIFCRVFSPHTFFPTPHYYLNIPCVLFYRSAVFAVGIFEIY